MDNLNFTDVWDRVVLLTGWKTQSQMADFLGFSSASITGAKGRGIFPIEWAYKVASGYNGSTDWLLTGEGPMRPGQESSTSGDAAPAVAQEQQALTTTENAVQSAPYAAFDALEVVEGMEMLTRIYSSGDTTYIRAINANLMAFSDAITMKKSNKDMQIQINILENRIAALEQRLEQRLETTKKVVNGS